MDWVWPLYETYVQKRLKRTRGGDLTDEAQEAEFVNVLRESMITVLVQEPWRGSVRFKCLAKYKLTDIFDLLNSPEAFLLSHFGGGKFKLNFHHGWHFVATKNFKPQGDPLWMDLPEIETEILS